MKKINRKGFLQGLAAMVGLGSLGAWKGLGEKKIFEPIDLADSNFDVSIAVPNLDYLKMSRAEAQRLYNYQISALVESTFSPNRLRPKLIVRRPVDYSKSVTKEADIGDYIS